LSCPHRNPHISLRSLSTFYFYSLFSSLFFFFFFFFNIPSPTEIYTLSLHDALPILKASSRSTSLVSIVTRPPWGMASASRSRPTDRKSTRLNSSHDQISYAVFCLKKKKKKKKKNKKKTKKKNKRTNTK